eukprot:365802-Chlamydomonas_euryale.AAC.5
MQGLSCSYRCRPSAHALAAIFVVVWQNEGGASTLPMPHKTSDHIAGNAVCKVRNILSVYNPLQLCTSPRQTSRCWWYQRGGLPPRRLKGA